MFFFSCGRKSSLPANSLFTASTVVRESVQLDIYCENLDADGSVENYTQFTLKNCEGKPTEFSLKDGDFWTPKYTMESRPKKGEPTMDITMVEKLPEVASQP
jgi:hypothetical protein